MMKKLMYIGLLILSCVIYTNNVNCAAAPQRVTRQDSYEIGVYSALEGRNTGKHYYPVPIRGKRIFAQDIIEAYCNLWRARSSEDIQIKYRLESASTTYDSDSDSSDLSKFKSCKIDDAPKYILFATKRYVSANHKKVELAAFGELEKDCEEEYESEL